MVLTWFYDDEDDGENDCKRDDDNRDDRGHPEPRTPVEWTPAGVGEYVLRRAEGCLLVGLGEEGGGVGRRGDRAVPEA